MRGSLVVLALAVTPLVARVSNAQAKSHVVKRIIPHTQQAQDALCKDRKSNHASATGLANRADPTAQGNKNCAPPPPPPPPAPQGMPDPSYTGRTTINGVVFYDLDGDGVMSADEVPLSGWTVIAAGPVSVTAVTDGTGAYSFSGLVAGTYLVCVVPPAGWTQTAISGAPSCGTGLFGYSLDAPLSMDDAWYSGVDFGFHSN